MPFSTLTLRRWVSGPIRLLVVSAWAATTLVSSAAALPLSAAAATDPTVYWGAYISHGQSDPSLLDTFEAASGKKMSIVHWGQAWVNGGTYQTFHADLLQGVRSRGSIPMLTWGSWSLGKGETQPDFRLANITNGAYDGYITQWARDAKAWGKPFFLRFNHEMNGTWQFPWAEQINGNQPGDYVKSWKHVHDIFTQVGATNATWVWCPNVSGSTTRALSTLYPGDSYVDWTCMDGYNRTLTSGDTWQSFAQVFGGSTYGGYNHHNTYQELVSLAPSKPIMLGEVSSTELNGSKAAWISDMLKTQVPTTFPNIKAVVWTEEKFSSVNWLVESSASSQSAFTAAIGTSTYAANTFASISGGPVQPLPHTPTAQEVERTVALVPVVDTYTASSTPSLSAAGTGKTLRADLQSKDTAVLRFDLSPLAGTSITSASLRLHTSTEAWAGSTATFDLKLVDSTDWKEAYMSYNNNVPVSNTNIGSLVAPKQPNTWYAINVSNSAIQSKAGGLISVALGARTGDVMIFNSREAGPSLAPQLIVTYK